MSEQEAVSKAIEHERLESERMLLRMEDETRFGAMFTGQAIKLEPGGVYVLEVDGFLTPDGHFRLEAMLQPFKEKHGIEFLILEKGLRIARADASVISNWEPGKSYGLDGEPSK